MAAAGYSLKVSGTDSESASESGTQFQPGNGSNGMGEVGGNPSPKDYKCAIVVIPPPPLWKPIQTVRQIHDRVYRRWMPHINLMYPFLPDKDNQLKDAAVKLRQKLKDLDLFRVRMEEVKSFKHKISSTLWLGADSKSEKKLKDLNDALEDVFPSYNDVSNISERGFTPHMSLGQWKPNQSNQASLQIMSYYESRNFEYGAEADNELPPTASVKTTVPKSPDYTLECQLKLSDLTSTEEALERQREGTDSAWKQLNFLVDHVHIISRQNYNDPFHIRVSIPLGAKAIDDSGQDNILVWPQEKARRPHATPHGGASGGAVSSGNDSKQKKGDQNTNGKTCYYWNFAFGANMSRDKLEKSRKIKPLESIPGVLPGWRLSFSHRGGMGTLMPITHQSVQEWIEQLIRSGDSLNFLDSLPLPLRLKSEVLEKGAYADDRIYDEILQALPTSPDKTLESLLSSFKWEGAHGVLHKISEKDYISIRRSENGYHEFELPIRAYDGRQIKAKVFISRSGQEIPCGSLRPTQRYRDLLASGESDYGVDKEYISWIRSFPTVFGKERTHAYYSNPDGPPPKLSAEWHPREAPDKANTPDTKNQAKRQGHNRSSRSRDRKRVQHL